MAASPNSGNQAAPIPFFHDRFTHPLILKIVTIIGLVVVLMIPLALVENIIRERESRRIAAVAEIGEAWGKAQRVFGPILAIPYTESTSGGWGQGVDRIVHLLPERYVVTAQIVPESRRRGIFEATLYRAELAISGAFIIPSPERWTPKGAIIQWQDARVVVDMRDRRSVRSGLMLTWRDGQPLPFAPSVADSGLAAAVPDLSAASVGTPLAFALTLSLRGSDMIGFLPMGRESEISVASPWPSPSFVGNRLPDTRDVSDGGFEASWTVSEFARDYPQLWPPGARNSLAGAVDRSEFGVRFVSVAGAYQQAERATKYGVLIIAATFLFFFLFETIGGFRLHAIQYGLVGLALCVFYLLLVSLAEQIGFGPAYALASLAVVGQVTAYCHGQIDRWRGTLALGALLTAMYGALYQLMRMEELALLVGSIGLFTALSAVMWVTRRLRWSDSTASTSQSAR